VAGLIAQYENGSFSKESTCCKAPCILQQSGTRVKFHACAVCKQELTIIPAFGAGLSDDQRGRIRSQRDKRHTKLQGVAELRTPESIAWQWNAYVMLDDFSDYVDRAGDIQEGAKPVGAAEKSILGSLNSARIATNKDCLGRAQLASCIASNEKIAELLLTEAYAAFADAPRPRETRVHFVKHAEALFGQQWAERFALMIELGVKI